MWWIAPGQLKSTRKWTMTARSDEDGGGPFGNEDCQHDTAEEAQACSVCDEYVSGVSGMPSKAKLEGMREKSEREEYDRLQKKYGDG
jgi:hypothetical protein